MEAATILQWTGRGEIEDLLSSVNEILRIERRGGKASIKGSTVIVRGAPPAGLALTLQFLPGVAWIAVGYSARSLTELARKAVGLAAKYLPRRATFLVTAESLASHTVPADVEGAITGAILGADRGYRVDEQTPRAKFRAAYWEDGGALGVELKAGPGGIPSGGVQVDCLVSGGMHSAVLVWHALLSGYKVRMVHIKMSDESERAAAALYAEMSNRVDPRKLSIIESVEGAAISALEELTRVTGRVPLAGIHATSRTNEFVGGMVSAPLMLLTEEEFATSYSGLSLRPCDSTLNWTEKGGVKVRWKFFRGVRTDVNGVLDGLSRPRPLVS